MERPFLGSSLAINYSLLTINCYLQSPRIPVLPQRFRFLPRFVQRARLIQAPEGHGDRLDDCIFAVFILCFATPDFLEHVCIGGAGRRGAGEDIVQYGVVQRLAVADAGDGGAGIVIIRYEVAA